MDNKLDLCIATFASIFSHTIVGPTGLVVTPDGIISTSLDNVFDYDRQKQVIVQIIATDTLTTREVQRLHTAYAQLTINLIDVNNQTPEIRMVRHSKFISYIIVA